MMAHGNAVRQNFPGMTRGCSKCGDEIIVTEQMCKKRTYHCSPCVGAAATNYVQQNREKKRQWNREYATRKSSKRAAKTKAYRAANPEKTAAHQKVQAALRNGSLQKGPCEVCGSDMVHGHHDDYSQPLAVRWLCHTHHMEHHMLEARK